MEYKHIRVTLSESTAFLNKTALKLIYCLPYTYMHYFSLDLAFPRKVQSFFIYIDRINLALEAGELVAVVGTVGCGKSSFLSACLGEMSRRSGKAYIRVCLKKLTTLQNYFTL